MASAQLNRWSARLVLVFSVVALLMVVSGYFMPPQPDEGAAAHIFQLSIMALVPALLLFLMTADWSRPARSLRALYAPVAALIVAFGALYYLEHYR